MAKVFGAAGEHAARQSVVAFKKMFLTLTGVIAALALSEGIIFSTLLFSRGRPSLLLGVAVVFALAVILVCRKVTQRVDRFESDRMSWRMGALGECEVAAELEALSDEFTIFNNVNTRRGNLDQIVVGPTGLFALETKNWTGVISSTPEGEHKRNGRTSTAPYVRKLLAAR